MLWVLESPVEARGDAVPLAAHGGVEASQRITLLASFLLQYIDNLFSLEDDGNKIGSCRFELGRSRRAKTGGKK